MTEGTTLGWDCHHCHKRIKAGDGYLFVDKYRAFEVEREALEWSRLNPGPIISGAALLDYPAATRWTATHRSCDAEPESNSYWIDVARADTHGKLLTWTLHLMRKTWTKHTDWTYFIERKIGGTP